MFSLINLALPMIRPTIKLIKASNNKQKYGQPIKANSTSKYIKKN